MMMLMMIVDAYDGLLMMNDGDGEDGDDGDDDDGE